MQGDAKISHQHMGPFQVDTLIVSSNVGSWKCHILDIQQNKLVGFMLTEAQK